MGSFLSQRYISLYGNSIQGVILSGTSGNQGPILNIGIRIAKKEVAKEGPKAKSPLLNNLSFGNYNKKFKPTRTDFDWLSRDEKEVDKYIEDPYCGGIFTTSFYYDFFRGLKENFKKVIRKYQKTHLYTFCRRQRPQAIWKRSIKISKNI